MAVNLITQAEYARRRGCDPTTVRDAIKAGRITLIDGKIDPTVADIQWKDNTRAKVSRVATQAAKGALTEGNEQVQAELINPGGDQVEVDTYTTSRNRREAAEASRAELELAELQRSLIRIDAVKAALSADYSSTRDALLQIPSRLSPLLAAESDASQVQTILYNEIHQALQHLAGTPERLGRTEATTTTLTR